MIRIGVDAGGMNTDAVIMDGSDFVAGSKRLTTPDIIEVRNALAARWKRPAATHRRAHGRPRTSSTRSCAGATSRRRGDPHLPTLGLQHSAVLRLALGPDRRAGRALPPDPWRLRDGRARNRCAEQGRAVAGRHRPARRGHRNRAQQRVSTVRSDMEEQAFDIITGIPDQSVTKSTDIGRLGCWSARTPRSSTAPCARWRRGGGILPHAGRGAGPAVPALFHQE